VLTRLFDASQYDWIDSSQFMKGYNLNSSQLHRVKGGPKTHSTLIKGSLCSTSTKVDAPPSPLLHLYSLKAWVLTSQKVRRAILYHEGVGPHKHDTSRSHCSTGKAHRAGKNNFRSAIYRFPTPMAIVKYLQSIAERSPRVGNGPLN
jgi:hypothetical protein